MVASLAIIDRLVACGLIPPPPPVFVRKAGGSDAGVSKIQVFRSRAASFPLFSSFGGKVKFAM